MTDPRLPAPEGSQEEQETQLLDGDRGVQIRPVRRADASGKQEGEGSVQIRAYRQPPRPGVPRLQLDPAPAPAAVRPSGGGEVSRSARPAATRPAPELRPAAAPVAPGNNAPAPSPAPDLPPEGDAAGQRSGWLQSALSDWIQTPAEASRVQIIRAAPAAGETRETSPRTQRNRPEVPGPGEPPRLPVDLLDGLWDEDGVRTAGQPPAAPSPPSSQPLPAAGHPWPSGLPPEDAPVVPVLEPMFSGAAPYLARFLPLSEPLQLGLNARFCDLHSFLKYLHELSWYGYLHVTMGGLSTYALVYEGRVVAAAAINATGEQALGELLALYEQGATLATYPLPPTYAHVLSGVGSRAWKFDLTEDFTGLYADPEGALFYSRGEIVATIPAGLPYEGAFPAPLRPQTLILPRSFAGWAHQRYAPTLRGRDVNNPITGVYHEFRSKYGEAGARFIRALGEHLTPAEYAVRADAALHELEPLLQEFRDGGYLREQDS